MRKLKYFGYSLTPMFIWLTIQVAATIGFSVLVGLIYGFLHVTGDAGLFAEYMKAEFVSIVSVLTDTGFLVFGYFWLRRLKSEENQGKRTYTQFFWKTGIRVFFLGIILQCAIGMFLILIQALNPQIMESHHKALESLGMYAPTFWSVLYTVVLAPVTEEVLYRGLTLKILEKAFPFWTANLIQAFYFGVIHGNLVQGLYAFVMGVLFGIVIRKYGTLKAVILLHFTVNLSGILISNVSLSIFQRILIIVISMMVIFLFREKRGNV